MFSTKTGTLLAAQKKHTDWIRATAFSPEGLLYATADSNGSVHVWETQSGKLFWDLRGHTKAVTSLSWRPDSNQLATVSEDGTIRVWNMHTGEQIKKWTTHDPGTLGVCFSPDGHVASSGRDGFVRLWTQDGKQIRQFGPFGKHVLCVSVSPSGNRVFAGNARGTTTAWETSHRENSGRTNRCSDAGGRQ